MTYRQIHNAICRWLTADGWKTLALALLCLWLLFLVAARAEIRNQEYATLQSRAETAERMLQELNIPHKGFHALRHTFATRALECGMDVKTLAEILGHKNPMVTLSRYTHSLMEHKSEMMNKIGRLLQ